MLIKNALFSQNKIRNALDLTTIILNHKKFTNWWTQIKVLFALKHLKICLKSADVCVSDKVFALMLVVVGMGSYDDNSNVHSQHSPTHRLFGNNDKVLGAHT